MKMKGPRTDNTILKRKKKIAGLTFLDFQFTTKLQ